MRTILMTTAAGLAILATPALAQDNGGDGRSSLELDLRYANNIDTSLAAPEAIAL